MNSDLAELLSPAQREEVVAELTEELRQKIRPAPPLGPINPYIEPGRTPTGKTWARRKKEPKDDES